MKKLLPRSTPAAQGVSSAAISRFLDTVQAQKGLELHSFMLLRHGYTVAEASWKPYTAERPHMLFSLSKSFTSTAVGFAVAEGLLNVDDAVLSFFQEEAPENPGKYWDELKVRHLLSMNTGHGEEPTFAMLKRQDSNWAKEFFNHPISHRPGTHFLYNTGATYMLSVIVQRLTGQRVLDYLSSRLLQPLGIEGAKWEQCPMGYDTGGFGLAITIEDIAKFGQFLLQRGKWEGKQLLPAAWVDEATCVHSDNSIAGSTPDWQAGYGYQFWRCAPDCYRGDGAFGQYCIVIPPLDAVIAITGGLGDMQAVLTHLWEQLLPGIGTAPEGDENMLAKKLNNVRYDAPVLQASSPMEAALSGRTFILEHNIQHIRSVRFDFTQGACAMLLTVGSDDVRLRFGRGQWQEGVYPTTMSFGITPRSNFPIAASFTWGRDNVLVLTARDLGSPFVLTWAVELNDSDIELRHSANVSFGPAALPAITGKAN